MFGRFVSGYALGYVSDRVGRKPVIVVGLFFMIILSLVFGFSESFAWAIGSRCENDGLPYPPCPFTAQGIDFPSKAHVRREIKCRIEAIEVIAI